MFSLLVKSEKKPPLNHVNPNILPCRFLPLPAEAQWTTSLEVNSGSDGSSRWIQVSAKDLAGFTMKDGQKRHFMGEKRG